jgi:hypothetical protein
MDLNKIFESLYQNFLSERNKEKSERLILRVAIFSFIVHLLIIGLVNYNIISINEPSNLFKNPIAAIYTPFSFILVYEVYLLIYYLPKSTSIYVSKQYEIITLIIFRRLFKDLSELNLSANWFNDKNDLQFTFDLITAIILFYLIYLFHIHRSKIYKNINLGEDNFLRISKFINTKKIIAVILVPILVFISVFSLLSWSLDLFQPNALDVLSFKNINNIFFEQFFTILIITDVFLLLFSFFHTDQFHKVIRNSGFIISTILLRISFSVDGIINNVLIITAVVFGLLVIVIHNQFEKQLDSVETKKSNDLEV